MSKKGKFFIGKVKDFSKRKGWFFGQFMEEGLLKSDLVEVAWQNISNKKPNPQDKHFHKKTTEINIVISGWVKITLNGKQHKVEKGEFYILYPYTVIEAVEAGNDTELIVISAPSAADDKFLVK